MKFTYKWLLQFLDTNLQPNEIGQSLTKIGIEVEEITDRSSDLGNFIVAEILETSKHPNADKLQVCKVDNGREVLQIVCGAPNARAGIKVVLAEVGAIIPNGSFKIKASEIRGVKSNGMLCSFDELLIGTGPNEGIIELDPNSGIGKKAISYLGLDDVVYDVSITPNRGDWFGVYGIARDLAASGCGVLKSLDPISINSNLSLHDTQVKIDEVSFFAFARITDIGNNKSPDWMINLLKNIGIEPVSAVVDITNYFAVSFARPLHAYDAEKISGHISIDKLTSKQSFKALNGKEYTLEQDTIVIADDSKICALPGIIGGDESKCDLSTKSIILEAANFDKVSVARLGREYQINTDARTRFERGIDESSTLDMLVYASNMIEKICGGKLRSISSFGKLAEKSRIKFELGLIKKRIGIDIDHDESIKILQRLGFGIICREDDIIELEIPSWRHDINCPEILAEEVARIYGYENIYSSFLQISPVITPLVTSDQKKSERLRRCAASLGYDEVITWSFMNDEYAKHFDAQKQELFIKNPISSELNYMRPTVIPNLLGNVARNLNRSINQGAFFELGPIFNGTLEHDEELVQAAVVYGNKIPESHLAETRRVDIFDIKSDLEILLKEAGIDLTNLLLVKCEKQYFHPNKSGSYLLGNKVIANFGQIHPKILTLYDIIPNASGKVLIPVYAFEIFINNVPVKRKKFGRRDEIIISPYQQVSRDYAFIFRDELKSGDLIKKILGLSEYIKNVDIFDIYRGDKIAEGHKSIAFRVIMQSDQSTLEDKEIEQISSKIIDTCEKMGGKIRA
ncbi:MAG: phenylalanine--tRNA ligase subunit beta [Rickettsiaceae bacterium]|nr:phenylalanine--tRNA ligase subunit beta [Rickettsiaceae bacterium]